MPEQTKGALVSSVETGSAAADDLRKGDIILSVNQDPVNGAKDAGELIAEVHKEGKRSVLLLVGRGDAQTFVAVPFAES